MSTDIVKTKLKKLQFILNADNIQEQFRNALKENSGPFVASVIDLYNGDKYLSECDPEQVVMEALKAATLKLPINKQLGFAYIVPYKNKGVQTPQFQLGYKGYIQLAMRTGQYKFLNSGLVREGQLKGTNHLTGQIDLSGDKKNDNTVGYFAYMELLNGFSKVLYMTKEQVLAHAKRYSKSFKQENSAWHTNFDEMALKTVVRNLLSHFGILSVEMISAFSNDVDPETEVENEIHNNANSEIIDVEGTPVNEELETDLPPTGTVGPGPGF